MKRLLIVIVTIVFLVGAAATAAHARRVPSRRDGDPDEVQSAKQNEELSAGSRPTFSQGRLTQRRMHAPARARRTRLHIKVRFPGKGFFLEK
jgi:hypothetical protein